MSLTALRRHGGVATANRAPGKGVAPRAECHIVAVPGREDTWVIYFPLQSLAFLANREAAELCKAMREGNVRGKTKAQRELIAFLEGVGVTGNAPERKPSPFRCTEPVPTATLLLPSDRCNLACRYCYSSAGKRGALMQWETARAAIDIIIENCRKLQRKQTTLGFHGGGEPTCAWDIVTRSVEYARSEGAKHGIRIITSICTNGIMSRGRARWLSEHIDNIAVSFDGTPDLQNRLRPTADNGQSYPILERTVSQFDSVNKAYGFRVTVTADSQERIEEIYEHCTSAFRPSMVCIEPLFFCGRCLTGTCRPPAAEHFARGVKRIMDRAAQGETAVQYSGGRLAYLGTAFCGASRDNFFVTPAGLVTSCVEVTSNDDPRSSLFVYGKLDAPDGRFAFNTDRYAKLIAYHTERFDSCRDCFARWHCCGDCLAKAPDMTRILDKRNSFRCTVNRDITLHQLLAKLDTR